MSVKRKNMIAGLRKVGMPRNGYISRDNEGKIYISWESTKGYTQVLTDLTTKDARLIAKRINSFIDAGG